ncbi:MAG: 2-hydroxychromene-2-carboxylate isomerase [Gammaproteobacteria bacterium]|nr:2-hydroxychromene-2-carboxylate isomerase [Gammaproteobacteria bacterium]NIM74599.1 2-hydroxychromene-2-carboxylate isomerase [Gammaproteobacteria bacterium]NIO26432.1 2-hydroxychromene-2-carboxylate isomerase [Gammaproteobacteria bacterium]NIO66984.1 2-hydroxychromene-2-carboxylate isomerase [Gammaproteobacteria bacterium]NIP46818.1 2-hydroxychromene-2-carboxylate isomerase [Gammaproteobacteria bacterium]
MQADWYFDFISPYAYLQLTDFDRLPDSLQIRYRPILLAGLLGHWGQKGPAEIPGKRRHTYRQCQWIADRAGIPFRFPPAHPFNPLRALRLCIALGAGATVVGTIFGFIFGEGRDVQCDDAWRTLAARLGVEDADALVAQAQVKDTLRRNTEEAVRRGVFGVPTFVVGEELFWGADATDMLLDYLADPSLFSRGEMARLDSLPVGAERR